MSTDKDTPDLTRDRRSVLRGAAVVGVAGVAAPLLAACGGGDDSSSGSSAGSSSSASSSDPSSDPTSAPTSAGSSSAPASSGTVLGPKSDVPVGGGKIYNQKVVVTQPTAGQFKGFSAICTHQGCPVGEVSGGTINCPCHGSKFSITDGSVKNGPATQALAAVDVKVDGSNIVGPAS